MDSKLQNQLYDKYPRIFRQKDLSITESCMPWGIDTNDGWYDIIERLCDKIARYSLGKDWHVEAIQVKEKFGGLRFYIDGGDDQIDKFVEEAISESYKTCEVCGKPGKPNKEGWIVTLCLKCRRKRNIRLKSRQP